MDAISRLMSREGYSGISMVAVAEEAGVSRRLVYDHFPDLPALYEEFFLDRITTYLAVIDTSLGMSQGDITASFSAAFAELLEMPLDVQRTLQILASDFGLPELNALRGRFRLYVEDRWLTIVPEENRKIAQARLWMVIGGLLGLVEIVSRGDVTKQQAMRLGVELVNSMKTSSL